MKIPIIQPYIDTYKLGLHDNRDGLMISRRGYFWGNLFCSFAGYVTDGIFYTTLLLLLLGDADTETYTYYMGLIGAVPGIAALSMLFSAFLFEHRKKRKPMVFLLRGIYYFCNIVLFPVIVMLPLDIHIKAPLFLVALFLKTSVVNLSNPAINDWHIYCLPEFCRSDFFAMNSVLSTVLNALFTFLLGLYMDYFKANQQLLLGILIMRGVSLLFIALEFGHFNRMEEPEYNKGLEEQGQTRPTIKQILFSPLKSKPFMTAVIIYAVYNMAIGFPGSFFSTYLIDEKGANLSYLFLSIASICGIPCSILMMSFWSKKIHQRGWLPVLATGMLLTIPVYLMNCFVTAQTAPIYIVSAVYGALISGCMGLPISNLVFLRAPKDLRTSCIALFFTTGSLSSALSAYLGSLFIAATNGHPILLFGLTIENRSYIYLVSAALLLAAMFVVLLLIRSEKKQGQSVEETPEAETALPDSEDSQKSELPEEEDSDPMSFLDSQDEE